MTGKERALLVAPAPQGRVTKSTISGSKARAATSELTVGCDDIAALKARVDSSLLSLQEDFDEVHAAFVRDLGTSYGRLLKRMKFDTQACKTHTEELQKQQSAILAQSGEDIQEMKDACKHISSKVQSATMHFIKQALPEIFESAQSSLEILRKRHASA